MKSSTTKNGQFQHSALPKTDLIEYHDCFYNKEKARVILFLEYKRETKAY